MKVNQILSNNLSRKGLEFYRYFRLFIWSFYATIRYGCKMKNDRQETNAIKI